MSAPVVKVSINFSGSTWTDVTAYYQSQYPINITGGRTDGVASVAPGRLSGLTLDNSDGRFTVGYSSGAYYPNVRAGKKIRIQVQNPTTLAYVDRFTGRIDGFRISWAAAGNLCLVNISATDMLVDLLRDYDTNDYMSDYFDSLGSLDSFWPMTFGSVTQTKGSTALTRGGPTPSLEAGPQGDARPLPIFTSWDTNHGFTLTKTIPEGFRIGFAFKSNTIAPGGGTRVTGNPFVSCSTSGNWNFSLSVDASGYVLMEVWGTDINVGPIYTATVGTENVCDGQWRYIWMGVEDRGTNQDRFYVKWVTPGTSTIVSSYYDGAGTGFQSGPAYVFAGYYAGTYGHMSYWTITTESDVADVLLIHNRVMKGDPPATIANTITAQATLAGYTSGLVGTPRTSLGYVPAPPVNAKQVMGWIEDTEGGITWADGTGTIQYESRDQFTSNSTSLTVTAFELGGDVSISADGDGLVNRGTVDNMDVNVSTGRSVSTDSTSIGIAGTRPRDLVTYSATASWASTRAPELISVSESLRISELDIDVMSMVDSQQVAVLATQMWHRISVTNLPSMGNFPSTQALRVEGWTESLAVNQWSIKYSTSQP